jgi:pyruvate/2-oxoglutarate dehydrogenase complex dihydrolipoamide acyltransferase (E2) component
MKLHAATYHGPHDEVELYDAEQDTTLIVAQGGTIEVSESTARSLGEQGVNEETPEGTWDVPDFNADHEELAEAWANRDAGEPAPPATANAIALAEAEGIDLRTIDGTGAEGRITVPDVKGAVEARDAQGDVQASPDADGDGNVDGEDG